MLVRVRARAHVLVRCERSVSGRRLASLVPERLCGAAREQAQPRRWAEANLTARVEARVAVVKLIRGVGACALARRRDVLPGSGGRGALVAERSSGVSEVAAPLTGTPTVRCSRCGTASQARRARQERGCGVDARAAGCAGGPLAVLLGCNARVVQRSTGRPEEALAFRLRGQRHRRQWHTKTTQHGRRQRSTTEDTAATLGASTATSPCPCLSPCPSPAFACLAGPARPTVASVAQRHLQDRIPSRGTPR